MLLRKERLDSQKLLVGCKNDQVILYFIGRNVRGGALALDLGKAWRFSGS